MVHPATRIDVSRQQHKTEQIEDERGEGKIRCGRVRHRLRDGAECHSLEKELHDAAHRPLRGRGE